MAEEMVMANHYITTKRVSTLQTNACSYIWVTQQTVKPLRPSGWVDLGLQPRVNWSNPAPNRGLYFINKDKG